MSILTTTKTILTSEEKAKALDEDCERSSVSVTYNKNMQIVDTNNYYPFGMNHIRQPNSHFGFGSYMNYKYNGKELQKIEVRDSPIHLKSQKEKRQTGMYDYGARFYMPDVGRWGVIDELSENFEKTSHYAYVLNDPINGFDPDGRDVIILNDRNAVAGLGHAAVIIGNEKDGFYYYSLNGTGGGKFGDPEQGRAYGTSVNPDIGTFLGYNLSTAQLVQKANTVNKDPHIKHNYNRYVRIKTTKKEDEKMKKKAAEAASVKKYIVVGQSCVTVPQNAFMSLLQYRKVPIWLNETEPVPNRWVDNIGARINFFYNFFLPEKKELKVTLNVGPLIPEGTDEKNKNK